MGTEKQWDDAARKLVELTEKGKLEWHATEASGRIDAIGPMFVSPVDGRTISVYGFRYKAYIDLENAFDWVDDVAVEFVGGNLEVLYRWPKTRFHRQLLDAVQYSASDAQGFLDSFLKEKA